MLTEKPEDATCGGKPLDLAKIRTVVLGEGQTLANVYVAVKSGLGNRIYSPPKDSVIIREIGCVYEPRVVGVMRLQELKVRNEDDAVHSVHSDPEYGVPFHSGHTVRGDEKTFHFAKLVVGKIVRCDVHPWMIGWVHVSDHPFFSVTKLDGHYSIPGLPSGDYELLAWHERFKDAPLTAKVRVEAGRTATLDFTFEAPRK